MYSNIWDEQRPQPKHKLHCLVRQKAQNTSITKTLLHLKYNRTSIHQVFPFTQKLLKQHLTSTFSLTIQSHGKLDNN